MDNCDFVEHFADLVKEMIEQTRKDGKEHGFTATRQKDWSIVQKCDGECDSISLKHPRDIEDTEFLETYSFHTHPSNLEASPSTSDILYGRLFKEVVTCIGSEVEVKCWCHPPADDVELNHLWRIEEWLDWTKVDNPFIEPYWNKEKKPCCHRVLPTTPEQRTDLAWKHFDTTKYLYSDEFRKAKKL